ncbi:hypothetical protein PoB_002816300 [Plakobranchus ocellatus]|uniref:Uncharacterized protein n=1 Tax=Plakobranchus ocellatus TaxID=259542 RepID=A0AAV4A3A1_9GAST|nr:hypothetical protein PoB_002816300 [Plakobranchus ocellatus]
MRAHTLYMCQYIYHFNKRIVVERSTLLDRGLPALRCRRKNDKHTRRPSGPSGVITNTRIEPWRMGNSRQLLSRGMHPWNEHQQQKRAGL